MQKSAFTTVFLIAVLITGAITTALPSIIEIEATPDKKVQEKVTRDSNNKAINDYSDSEMDYKYEANAEESYANQYSKDPETAKYDDYNKYPKEELNKPYSQESPYLQMYPYTQENSYTQDDPYTQDNSYSKSPETAKYDDYNKYPKEESNKPDPTTYPESDQKTYVESNDVKSPTKITPKKIKIIDCNNRNINAQGLEDFSTIEPILDKAFNSNSADKEDKFNNNPENSQVYYIAPDTKIIFKCNNQNHNLHPETDNSDVDDTNTITSSANNVLGASTASNNDNTGVNSLTGNLGASQAGSTTSTPSNSGTSMSTLPSVASNNDNTGVNSLTGNLGASQAGSTTSTPSNSGTSVSTLPSVTGVFSSLIPSIQQNNPTMQQNNPSMQQNSSLPVGDPMLQLETSLSPIS